MSPYRGEDLKELVALGKEGSTVILDEVYLTCAICPCTHRLPIINAVLLLVHLS
jgi:hypothetical protein